LTVIEVKHYKAVMDIAYIECGTCKNYFFIADMDDNINDPTFCPYCGCEFDETYEVNYED